jgi:hypothetical protein
MISPIPSAQPMRLTTRHLLPSLTDRAFFVGTTGSGKTTLAQTLLMLRPYVVVLDSKRTIQWGGYHRVERLRDAVDLNASRIIYAPQVREFGDRGLLEGFFRWVFERRNTTVYVDELLLIMDSGGQFPWWYQACVAQGRERGVEVWSATQRPHRIPIVALSESEHYYVFRMAVREDRARIEGMTGLDEEAIALLRKRQFYHVPVGDPPRGPLMLALDKGGEMR